MPNPKVKLSKLRNHKFPVNRVNNNNSNNNSNPNPNLSWEKSEKAQVDKEFNTQNSQPLEPKIEVKTNTDQIAMHLQQKISTLEVELQTAKVEMEDWKNKSMRLAADLQNAQKQSELDSQQAKKNAKKHICQAILPFLNTLNLAFAYAPQSSDINLQKFVQTLTFSFQQLTKDLELKGVEILTPKIGQDFDATWMTALNSSEEETLRVKQIVSIGLKIDNQLIQPSSVMV